MYTPNPAIPVVLQGKIVFVFTDWKVCGHPLQVVTRSSTLVRNSLKMNIRARVFYFLVEREEGKFIL